MTSRAVAAASAPSYVPTSRADLDDQRWLDRQVEAVGDGIAAVLDIARNWEGGRNLARLHPGASAAEYVVSRVGALGRSVVPALLEGTDWSNRQIAAVAGVDEGTVRKEVRNLPHLTDRGPVLGADGKRYPPRTVEAVVIDREGDGPDAAHEPGAAPGDPEAWRAEAGRRWPDAMDATDPHVLGRGRWATVSWCGPLAVHLHAARPEAERAMRMIDDGGCGHGCWGDHEIADLAGPEEIDAARERARGPERAAHFRACGECRDWAGGRAPGAATRRAAGRVLRAAR